MSTFGDPPEWNPAPTALDAYTAARKARLETEAQIPWAKSGGFSTDSPAQLEQELAVATAREQDILRDAMVASDSDEAGMLKSAASDLGAVARTVGLARAGVIRNYREAQRRLKDAQREVAVAQSAAAEAKKAMDRLVNRPLCAWGHGD